MWCNETNALDRSITIAKDKYLSSTKNDILSLNSVIASSVECFVLNPYCLSSKVSWNSPMMDYKRFLNQVCHSRKQWYYPPIITFALSPCLYRGVNFAVINSSGYIPVMRDWLMIMGSGLISAGAKRVQVLMIRHQNLMEIHSLYWCSYYKNYKCNLFYYIFSLTDIFKEANKCTHNFCLVIDIF